MFEKRIIVGGIPRSGTTLFRYILDASPQIIAGPETSIFLNPLNMQQRRIDRVAPRVNRALDIGEEPIRRAITAARTSIEAFDMMMEAYCRRARASKTIWAEKTPWNCASYTWLAWDDPQAYFISLIRDGRDVVTSVMEGETAYHVSIQSYIEAMRFIMNFQHQRHLIVKYEEMVSQPEESFRRVMEFLEIDFTPQMLESYRQTTVTRDPSKVRQPKVQQAISTQWIERWREPQFAQRIREFNANQRAVQWLARAGYSTQPAGAFSH